MKRTPLRRSTKPMARHSRLKAKGGSRFPHRRCQPYLDWLKEQSCVVRTAFAASGWAFKCEGTSQPAHVKSRGAGGNDVENCIPLCARHHRQQHKWGIRSFQAFYGLDLTTIAREYTDRWLQTPEGQAWGSR